MQRLWTNRELGTQGTIEQTNTRKQKHDTESWLKQESSMSASERYDQPIEHKWIETAFCMIQKLFRRRATNSIGHYWRAKTLGANEWVLVGNLYTIWVQERGSPIRESKILKQNFDRLLHENKHTVNPTCLTLDRRAKLIIRSILDRAIFRLLAIDYETGNIIAEQATENEDHEVPLGARQCSRSLIRAGSRRHQTRSVDAAELLTLI